jgi:hypothetical protein
MRETEKEGKERKAGRGKTKTRDSPSGSNHRQVCVFLQCTILILMLGSINILHFYFAKEVQRSITWKK